MHNTWFCCYRMTSGAYSFPNVYIEYHTSVFSMKKFHVFFDCKATEDSLTVQCVLYRILTYNLNILQYFIPNHIFFPVQHKFPAKSSVIQ